jgi:hypothetical protein
MRMLFIGVLTVSVLIACSSSTDSVSSPTHTLISLTATAELSSTAATVPKQPDGFEYSSVTEALADLKTRDDVSITILQGWTIVTEADGLTNWSFPPPDHPAFPAVAKRVLYRDQDGWHLKMDVLCEAKASDCEEFVKYFESLNEPIHQLSGQE